MTALPSRRRPEKIFFLASLANLVCNGFGTILAFQHNLTSDFGGWLGFLQARRPNESTAVNISLWMVIKVW